MLEHEYAITNWGDGSDPSDIAPTLDTRDDAMMFILRLASEAIESFGRPIPVPELGPCGDGSVDVHWGHKSDRELLLNVRNDHGGAASYYGDTKTGATIKGVVRMAEANVFLAAWLLEKT